MIKSLKIAAILFCFALTFIVFKNGVPSYTNPTTYDGYIAALILFFVGIALLINLVMGKAKPLNGYREYIKKVKATKLSTDLEAIEHKIKLLKQSYNDGLLNKIEFNVKMEELTHSKDSLNEQSKSETEFNQKKKKLLELFENEIITKDEFGDKIKDLKTELHIDGSNCIDPTINDDKKIYFVSDCKQYGPLPLSYVMYLLKTKRIHPNCFYKLQEEDSYSHRIRELSHS